MCTVVCRVFPDAKAVPLTTIEEVHCPSGIDIPLLKKSLTSPSMMEAFGNVFVNSMPQWIREHFFDPEHVRHRLDLHSYHHSQNVRQMRCLNNMKR